MDRPEKNTNIIYFDAEDAQIDGNGWNILHEDESVVVRFPTLSQAKQWCRENDLHFVVSQ